MQHFLKITSSSLLLSAASLSVSLAATYPEPEITSIMFHVDKLPLDKDRMKEVSRDLVILASKNANDNQQHLTQNARLLAIAIRLDSNNLDAKKLNVTYNSGQRAVEPDDNTYQSSLKKTLQLVRALSSAQKGTEVYTFSQYIKDALRTVASDHPQIKDHQVNKQRWKNVVREVVDVPPVQPEPEDKPEEKMADVGDSSQSKVDEQTEDTTSPNPEPTTITAKWNFLSSVITIPAVLFKKENDKTIRYWQVADFKLNWKPRPGESGRINLKVKLDYDDGKRQAVENIISNLLAKTWKDFPSADVDLLLPGNYSQRNGNLSALPIATQLYASLKNTPIPAGVRMLGETNNDGEISSGSLIWLQLKELRKDEELKQTLFCPLTAEKALAQLVALEEAEFFVRNEVVLVKDIEDVTQYFGAISDEGRKLAHEKFVMIRDEIGSRSVGSFSVNKKIRGSLEEILVLNPNHLSAKMILLRGDTKRSSNIDPYYLAEEFRPTLDSLKYINDSETKQLSSSYLQQRADEIDEQLESVSRYIDRSESDLISALEEICDELENTSRALKRNDEDYEKRAAVSAHDRFRKHYKDLENYLKDKQK